MSTFANRMFYVFLFSAMSMLCAETKAQSCPPGYYPIGGAQAGWHGCAPMDGGISNESENNEPEQPEKAQEVWEDRWGALATANGAMGQATSKRTKEEAEREAMADCRARAGSQQCKLKTAYYNQCIALSWGSEGNVAARGPDLNEVEQRANEKCAASFTNCKIYYSACSLPVRIR